MDVQPTEIPDVMVITPTRHVDARGHFSETWNKRDFSAFGIDQCFVQDNHAYSAHKGTIRGIHFQVPPHAQGKLVRAIRGAVFDVAVDLRRGSATFGKWAATRLDAESGQQMWIPAGFGHGYCVLEPDTEMLYKTTDFYSPDYERGILWSDPDIAITWPAFAGDPLVSEKDGALGRLHSLTTLFD